MQQVEYQLYGDLLLALLPFTGLHSCTDAIRGLFFVEDMDLEVANVLTSHIKVPFHVAEEAAIAWATLSVDKEPPRGGCSKTFKVTGWLEKFVI